MITIIFGLFIATLIGQTSAEAVTPEYQYVTCFSSIKLTGVANELNLNSHSIPYGTGSKEQSVTSIAEITDPNCLFLVESESLKRGDRIKCGSKIRLSHNQTGKYLNIFSEYTSPISSNMEVSCIKKEAGTFPFEVICMNSKAQYWERDQPIRLKHSFTGSYLSTSSRYQFPHHFSGHVEVFGKKTPDTDSNWKVRNGVFQPNE